MIRFVRLSSLLAVNILVVINVLIMPLLNLSKSQAEPVSARTTLISVEIAPVRNVFVDKSGAILRIESNTPINITPLVFLADYSSSPITMTSNIYDRYLAILAHTNTEKTGDIYISQRKNWSSLKVHMPGFQLYRIAEWSPNFFMLNSGQ